MNSSQQFELVSQAIYWLIRNRQDQPQLRNLAARTGMSPSHLQRIFQDFAGVTPKQFLKFLTKEEALLRLRSGTSVMDAALECGLSGSGRLHDLIVTTEAMTPGEVRKQGAGVVITYGFAMTPFGDALLAWTERGITFLAFCQDKSRDDALTQLQQQWPASRYEENTTEAKALVGKVFNSKLGEPLRIWLRGSPFQLKVWEALLAIPTGTHCTYGDIARHLGNPEASRAVGTAVGRNPVSWLIPCHRVITSTGKLGGYRWGTDAKQAMIGWEAALGKQPS